MRNFLQSVLRKFDNLDKISLPLFEKEITWTGYKKTMFTDKDYVLFARPFALQVEKDFGLPALISITQSAHESRWGNSDLSKEGNNYFGMTVGSDWITNGGAVISYPSTEISKYPPEKIHWWNRAGDVIEKKSDGHGGSILRVLIDFRKYGSPLDSFVDWAEHIKKYYFEAYQSAVNKEYDQFFIKAGEKYATDTSYQTKCIALMDKVKTLISQVETIV